MKFKLIFALFNGIILISFLFVFLMPLFILGFDYTAGFWGQNWYLILIFAAILAALDLYFVFNWRTFQLLEQEDWSGLATYLEKRLFSQQRYNDQSIRLLCNAWVVQGKPLEILRLEALIRENKPGLLPRYGLLLGIPYLMKNDPPAMVAFFTPLAGNRKTTDPHWLDFNLAFSFLANRQVAESIKILEVLAVQKKDRIVQLLALYLLDSNAASNGNDLGRPQREAAIAEFRSRFTPASFAKLVDRYRENLQVIILSKFINEASAWIFPGQTREA